MHFYKKCIYKSNIKNNLIYQIEYKWKYKLNYNILASWPFLKLIPKRKNMPLLQLIKESNNSNKEFILLFIEKSINGYSYSINSADNSLWNKQFSLLNIDNPAEIESIQLMLEYLISDSIYALLEIIKSHKIFGVNYVATSYSILANSYLKISFWCELHLLYQAFLARTKNSQSRVSNIINKVRELTGSIDQVHLSPWYNLEMALSNSRSALEIHNEGGAYRKMIENLYYLDDDFNDDILHFSLALERFKINNGLIEKQIKFINQKLYDYRVYNWNEYVKTGEL